MKWTEEHIKDLKQLCMDETPNKDIADYFGVDVTEIHAKRSQLGITIPKVKALKGETPMTVNPELEAALPKPSHLPASIKQSFTDLFDKVLLKMAHNDTSIEDAQIYCELGDELIELQTRYEKRLAKENAASGAGTPKAVQ